MSARRATEPESAGAEAPGAIAHRYLAFFARAAIGIVVVAFLLWHYDARPVLRSLARERPGFFIAAIAIYVAGQAMSSWRWQLLARVVAVEARWREFLAYYFVGMFTNLFVPGLVGGDAVRAIYLGRRTGRTAGAIASVLADRGVGLIALFWLAAAAAISLPQLLPPKVTRPAVVFGIFALAAFLAAPLIATAVPRLPRAFQRAAEPSMPYLYRPFSTVPALVLSIVLQISLAIGQWLLAVGLGLSIPMSLFLLVMPIANVITSVPITINGLGLRESSYLVLLGMAGLGNNDAIALGLLWFAVTILSGLTGAFAFVLTGFPNQQ